jgi:hypothetical protein
MPCRLRGGRSRRYSATPRMRTSTPHTRHRRAHRRAGTSAGHPWHRSTTVRAARLASPLRTRRDTRRSGPRSRPGQHQGRLAWRHALRVGAARREARQDLFRIARASPGCQPRTRRPRAHPILRPAWPASAPQQRIAERDMRHPSREVNPACACRRDRQQHPRVTVIHLIDQKRRVQADNVGDLDRRHHIRRRCIRQQLDAHSHHPPIRQQRIRPGKGPHHPRHLARPSAQQPTLHAPLAIATRRQHDQSCRCRSSRAPGTPRWALGEPTSPTVGHPITEDQPPGWAAQLQRRCVRTDPHMQLAGPARGSARPASGDRRS